MSTVRPISACTFPRCHTFRAVAVAILTALAPDLSPAAAPKELPADLRDGLLL